MKEYEDMKAAGKKKNEEFEEEIFSLVKELTEKPVEKSAEEGQKEGSLPRGSETMSDAGREKQTISVAQMLGTKKMEKKCRRPRNNPSLTASGMERN